MNSGIGNKIIGKSGWSSRPWVFWSVS